MPAYEKPPAMPVDVYYGRKDLLCDPSYFCFSAPAYRLKIKCVVFGENVWYNCNVRDFTLMTVPPDEAPMSV